MKSSEIRERSNEELKSLLDNINADLFKKKMSLAVNQNEKPAEIRKLRRDIAKIKTIIREREIQAAKA